MKLEIISNLPSKWKAIKKWPEVRKALFEFDVKARPSSRLKAKVLIFANNKDLLRFWKIISPHKLGKGCLGVVNSLAYEKTLVDKHGAKTTNLCCDASYFCVIGLLVKHLSDEIICHEATHAGFAWAKRVNRNIFAKYSDLDEELVCYPTGRLSSEIFKWVFLNVPRALRE